MSRIGREALLRCGATHLRFASLGAHQRRTAEPALAACPGTCRVHSCRAHVYKALNGLAPPYLSSAFTRCAVSTSTPLGVHQPTAGAVLPAVHDWTEGVPDRWRSCLERSSISRYVCSVACRLWTAIEDRTFLPLLQCCLTVLYSYSGPWKMDFLFRPL